MSSGTWIIAGLTFREAFRRKVILGVAVLSVIFVALYAFGFHLFVDDYNRFAARSSQRGGAASGQPPYELMASAMVLLGLYTVNFLAGVMTIFASVGAIAGEIDAGTLHAIVPKPLARWEILLGKYIGFAVMLIAYIALMVGSVLLTARLIGSYVPPSFVQGTLLIILVAMILLSLTMFGSTIFSTVANGVIVFMLYGMAVTGGLVEQVGTALNNNTLMRIGVISSVVIPSDSMWRLASYVVQPRLAVSFFGPNPLGTTVPPSDFAVRYAVGYCVFFLAAAILVFRRRDL
jgi:ABC-type transport system involved in multi-copper enzyme maturation permease subunit